MERYAYMQKLPNSPLTPLTPLDENSSFNFDFVGNDGSLDAYMNDVRQMHHNEQRKDPQISATKDCGHLKSRRDSPVPRQRYSEKFRRIRNIFEPQQEQKNHAEKPFIRLQLKDPPKQHCCHQAKECQTHKQPTAALNQMPNQHRPIIKIVKAPDVRSQNTSQEYISTPTNVRTPLKQKNPNIIPDAKQQKLSQRQLQEHNLKNKQQERRHTFLQPRSLADKNTNFLLASPVPLKPLCSNISKILHHRGLSMYCGIFQREEIDLYSFKLLTLRDLQQMGINNPKHCDIIMADVCYARRYF
uniref:SAM domain-containing protein n=1 Tax=Stomoxys calcitrans TaxID=35570 RepID=A0A1I8P000_STOCA